MSLSAEDLIAIVDIGASELDGETNTLTVNAKGPGEEEDILGAGVWGINGVVNRPYPITDDGSCQALVLRSGPGYVIGTRDTRINDVYGNMDPGDTCVTATGPEHAAKLLLKETTRLIALLTKDTQEKDFGITADGTNNKVQIFGWKQMLELSKDNFITIGASSDAGSSAIQIKPSALVLKAPAVKLGEGATQPVAAALPLTSIITTLSTWMVAIATAVDAKTPATVGVNLGVANTAVAAMSAQSALVPVQSVIIPTT